MKPIDLKDLTFSQLTDLVVSMGLPPFRAKQIFSWLYRPAIHSFAQMTDLSKELRATLAESLLVQHLHPGSTRGLARRHGKIRFCFRR